MGARDRYIERLLKKTGHEEALDSYAPAETSVTSAGGYTGYRNWRADEDDEEEEPRREPRRESPKENPSEEHEGHGNTRLPYGLCKAASIDTTGMKPRQAWDALRRGYGINPTDVYQYVDDHGTADGFMDGKKKIGEAEGGLEEGKPMEEPKTESQEEPTAEPTEEESENELAKEPKEELKKGELVIKETPKLDIKAQRKELTKRINATSLTDEEKKILKNYAAKTEELIETLDSGGLPMYGDYLDKEIKINKVTPSSKKFDEFSKKHDFHTYLGGDSNERAIYDLKRRLEKEKYVVGVVFDAYAEAVKFNERLHAHYDVLTEEKADKEVELAKSYIERIERVKDNIEDNDALLEWINEKQKALPTAEELREIADNRLVEIKKEVDDKKRIWTEQKKNPNYGKVGVREYSHCKTTDEAEKYIKDKLGIDADYSGMEDITPERANAINNTLMSMYENYGIKPSRVISDTADSSTIAYWVGSDKTLAVCHLGEIFYWKTWKWQEEKEKSFKDTYESEKKQYEYFIGQGNTEMAEFYKKLMNAAAEGLRECAEFKSKPYNYLKKGKEVESVIAHEMGHALISHAAEKNSVKKRNAIDDLDWEFHNKAEKELYDDVEAHGDWDKLTGYSHTSGPECFAECFSMYQMGDKDSLPDYIVKRIEDTIKAHLEWEDNENHENT